jgi:WD40 repeat protein
VTIWNTSNLADIKELQSIEISTKHPDITEINFKHDEPRIVAISTDSTTMFFDVHSGKLLSKTAELSTGTDSYTHAGLVFLPCGSTVCVGMNTADDTASCVRLYDYISGGCIGVIPYQQPAMDGIGVTTNFRHLVTTFNKHMVVKTELIDDTQRVAFSKIVQKLTLVEFYALLQLHQAKQQKCSANLSQPLLQYMQESFFDDADEGQKLIKKYFF